MTNVLTAMSQGVAGIIEGRAPLRAPSVSAAGKAGKARKAGKKAQKKARQLCQGQVAECETALTTLCEGEPMCLEGLACCALFATCDTTGALACIVDGGQA